MTLYTTGNYCHHGDEGTLPFLVTEGVKVSVVMFPSCSSSRLHTFTPSAAPAAMAAPSAVVSVIDGLTTRAERRKNWTLKLRVRSHWQRPRPIKNGLCWIVWRCSCYTETETEIDVNGFQTILSVSASVSVKHALNVVLKLNFQKFIQSQNIFTVYTGFRLQRAI